MTNNSSQKGFTLTELMFAMMFVTFLLIFSVTVIIQAMQIYNKGLSIRQINQSGRQLSEDFSRTLRNTSSASLTSSNMRLCTGQTSYVWNIGEPDPATAPNKYSPPNTSTPLRLVRVYDPGGSLCGSTADINKSNSREIVTPSLAVQCFTSIRRESSKIISINTVISTSGANSSRDVPATGTNVTCDRDGNPATPSIGIECDPGSDGAFCALGEFNTSVYVRN